MGTTGEAAARYAHPVLVAVGEIAPFRSCLRLDQGQRQRSSRQHCQCVGDRNQGCKGTWPEALPLIANFENECQTENFRVLPIAVDHARMAGLMQHDHRDPFDRLLAAQAIIEGLTLITVDRKLGALGASCAW